MLKNYLCYYECHVEDRTFYVHTLINAKSPTGALNQLTTIEGRHYTLQAKGCLGEFTLELAQKYMGNYIPKVEVRYDAEI